MVETEACFLVAGFFLGTGAFFGVSTRSATSLLKGIFSPIDLMVSGLKSVLLSVSRTDESEAFTEADIFWVTGTAATFGSSAFCRASTFESRG